MSPQRDLRAKSQRQQRASISKLTGCQYKAPLQKARWSHPSPNPARWFSVLTEQVRYGPFHNQILAPLSLLSAEIDADAVSIFFFFLFCLGLTKVALVQVSNVFFFWDFKKDDQSTQKSTTSRIWDLYCPVGLLLPILTKFGLKMYIAPAAPQAYIP